MLQEGDTIRTLAERSAASVDCIRALNPGTGDEEDDLQNMTKGNKSSGELGMGLKGHIAECMPSSMLSTSKEHGQA